MLSFFVIITKMSKNNFESNSKSAINSGLAYPLYRSEVPTSGEEWLKKKRIRDNTKGLWRVHDGLYDFTEFVTSHPGGAQWITSSEGTDITESFETHHLKGIAKTYLSNYFVRKATPKHQPFTFKEDGFYKTLKPKIASKLSEMPRSVRNESYRITDSLLLAFVFTIPVSCWAWSISSVLGITAMVVNSLILNFLVTSAHTYFHRADNWRMYLFNLNGQSFEEWRITHAMSHHMFTNTTLDAEISSIEPLLQLLPYTNKPFWARLTVFTWPLVGVMLFARPLLKRFFDSAKISKEEFKWPQLIPYFVPMWMYLSGGLPFIPTMLIWIGTNFLSSAFFVVFGLTAGHHTPENIYEGDILSDESMDWGIFQLKVVIDRGEYIGKPFLSLTRFGDHALHHLFPTLDQAELKYLYPALLDHCKEFDIELRTTTFFAALVNLFKQILRKGPKKY